MFRGIEDMPGVDGPIPNSDKSYPHISLTCCINKVIFFHLIDSPEGPVVINDK
jgi:hypothetical protein